MASKKVRPTSPPSGPALVRPTVGALLLTLSGVACGDDGTTGSDTANDSVPPMVASEGPMPNPTTGDSVTSGPPPMPNPTATGADSGTTGSDSGNDSLPPMPNPTATGSDSGTGTDTGTSGSSSTGPIPPMPPPGG